MLHSLQLIDTWRFLHPDTRDYTFHSIPHNRYSRIDYLFISQRDLHLVQEAHIGIQSLSDHAPISLTLDLGRSAPRPNTWRLNASLLTDPELLPGIASSLSEYFRLNATPESDPMMVWQAHKCYMRGELIRLGSQKKRKQTQLISDKIHDLESQHKQSLSQKSALKKPGKP